MVDCKANPSLAKGLLGVRAVRRKSGQSTMQTDGSIERLAGVKPLGKIAVYTDAAQNAKDKK
jgi:hypothetical protein